MTSQIAVYPTAVCCALLIACAPEPIGSGSSQPQSNVGSGLPTGDGAAGAAPAGSAGNTMVSFAGAPPAAGDGVPPNVTVSGGSGVSPTGGFDAGSDPGRNNVQPGQVCARLARIQCAGEAYCCPGRRNQQECEAVMHGGCVNELHLDAMSLNGVTGFDSAHASEAFVDFEAKAALCDIGIALSAASFTGLRGMFRGTKSAGANCRPATVTDEADSAGLLVSCLNPQGTSCRPHSVLTWSCDPVMGAGAVCFGDTNCKDGLFCNNPSEGFNGTCQQRKGVGQTCFTGNECADLYCMGDRCVAPSVQAAFCL